MSGIEDDETRYCNGTYAGCRASCCMAVELAADELERVPERIAGRSWRAEPRTQVRRYVTALAAARSGRTGGR